MTYLWSCECPCGCEALHQAETELPQGWEWTCPWCVNGEHRQEREAAQVVSSR